MHFTRHTSKSSIIAPNQESMTNNIVKAVLAILCVIVGYLCYDSIASTLRMQNQIAYVEGKIIQRLTEIKEAQFAYKDAYGVFAPSFDSLEYGLKTGRIVELKQVGELTEANQTVEIDTMFVTIADKLKDKITNFDSLRFVPCSDKVEFKIGSGTVNRNGVTLQVFEVIDPKPVNKKRALKVGSLSDAIYTGNWEKQEN